MDSSKVISILMQNGWELASIRGDHFNLKKEGACFVTTIPRPAKDLAEGVLTSLRRVTDLDIGCSLLRG